MNNMVVFRVEGLQNGKRKIHRTFIKETLGATCP